MSSLLAPSQSINNSSFRTISTTAPTTLRKLSSPHYCRRRAWRAFIDGWDPPRKTSCGKRQTSKATFPSFETFFIGAFVRAGQCEEHRAPTRNILTEKRRRPTVSRTVSLELARQTAIRTYVTKIRAKAPRQVKNKLSKRECRMLVDYNSIEPISVEEDVLLENPSEEVGDEPKTRSSKPVSASSDDLDFKPYGEAIKEFTKLLWDPGKDHETLYAAYKNIPSPRPAYLQSSIMHRFLNRLMCVEHKTEASMLRYMSVIEDMKAAGKTLNVHEWTSAIAFVGRCFIHITSREVGKSLDLWKQMESEAGIKANRVTFNVLFDVASKAGKFVLADMILREMRARKLKLDRYSYTNLIFYHGLKGNGAGVRGAYRDLVEAGQIVDTSVISCVISALVLCREVTAAEQVLDRAKALHWRKGSSTPMPPRDWKAKRNLGRALARYADEYQGQSQTQAELQASVPLAPDLQSYRVLVYHHSLISGNIERVTRLVTEMQHYQIPVDGGVFLNLFRGFHIHGPYPYSPWTLDKLEMTFAALVKAVDATDDGRIYVGPGMAQACISAFVSCADRPRADEVWKMLNRFWDPSTEEQRVLENAVASLWERREHTTRLPPQYDRRVM